MFAFYSSDKGLTSTVYRELKKLSPQGIHTPVKEWVHESIREFSMEEV
jgi:hypothetical protein